MQPLTEKLKKISQSEPEVARLLKIYSEIEEVYRQSLEAMGVLNVPKTEPGSSTSTTINFPQISSSSNVVFNK